MPRWFKRLAFRFCIFRLVQQIEDWNSRADALLIDRWSALEAQDASGYAEATCQSLAAKHTLRRLNTQHDKLVRQLERL